MPLAIIGMACRLPGADSLDEYWSLLVDGKSAIAEIPETRLPGIYFDPRKGVRGKSYTRMGGIVRERALDPALCRIPEEVESGGETSHKIMVEVAATACRHAGMDPFNMPVRNTGVYMGHARRSSLYGDLVYSTRIEEVLNLLPELDAVEHWTAETRSRIGDSLRTMIRKDKPRRKAGGLPDFSGQAVARLVSESLGLDGPYQAVDAACASSMHALVVAAQALRSGSVDMAIVGGASHTSWECLVLFSQAQALSATGSFPFDARANGFISSDGSVALVLKTLKQALADKDQIHGLIRGIGLSSDGRGKSLWAPNSAGQLEAFQRAYDNCGLNPGETQCIEAHGTSTQLGDATEVRSLASFLKDKLPPKAKIPIASVKANIGHTVEAAGVSGIIKMVLAMQNRACPRTINFEQPNQQIDFESTPFFVPTQTTEWQAPDAQRPRRAGVNSFGIGGVNAHVVLEEFQPETSTTVFMPDVAPREEGVAIIGVGAIFPGARTFENFRALLESRAERISNVTEGRWSEKIYFANPEREGFVSPTRRGGFVTDFQYDWRPHKIPPSQVELADPLRFMIVDAVDQAISHAGYAAKPFNRKRTAVVMGSILSGDFMSDLCLALRLPEFERDLRHTLGEHGVKPDIADKLIAEFRAGAEKMGRPLSDETGSFNSSTLASGIARLMDFMGGAFVIDAGDTSSFAALEAAQNLLLSGECDVVFCIGCQRHMAIDNYESYKLAGLLASERNGKSDGCVPGEGTGVLMLRRLSDARQSGDPILGVVSGVGAAASKTSVDKAIGLAAERALKNSGLAKEAVKTVHAMRMGLKDLDRQERAALESFYPSTSFAPANGHGLVQQIGHTMGASGMASMLAELAASTKQANGSTGLVSYSTRGLAYHALLSPGNPPPSVSPDPWRIIRMSASSPAALAAKIAQADPASLFESAAISNFRHGDHRLAIVANSVESLRQKLDLARRPATQPAELRVLQEQGVYFGIAGRKTRIAFLFPGQGSQYQGMLRELVAASPEAAAAGSRIDTILKELGGATLSEMAARPEAELANDVFASQLCVFAGGMILQAALEKQGIRPDVVCGHSYGEYPALTMAGVWTLEQALQITSARCQIIADDQTGQGVLMATNAGGEAIRRFSAGIEGVLAIANENSPEQTVVGGDKSAINELDRRLTQAGFQNRQLPVPRPFHTPLLAGLKEPFRKFLESQTLQPPRLPMLSSVTNRYVADPEEIRANLVEQFTQPVLFVDLIRRMRRDGINIFVEVGPRRVLSRLASRILPDDADVLIVPSDNPKRPGLEQIFGVRAALECWGACDPLPAPQTADAATPSAAVTTLHPILYFDATTRRKENLAEKGRQTKPVAAAPVSASSEPRDEMEAFLVNFICQQTGYPPEVVQLDADLEADLGIDSLKKAQLFGELSEQFKIEITPTGNLSLNAYPTLRHVLAFLKTAPLAKPEATAIEAKPPAAEPGKPIMSRFVLRMTEQPLEQPPTSPAWNGACLVVGQNPVADALREALRQRGAELVEWPELENHDPAEITRALEELHAGVPILHLFLATACDASAAQWISPADWQHRLERGLMLPYLLCQQWTRSLARAGVLKHATLASASLMGGDFGFSGNVAAPEGGAMTGLLKSIRRELPDLCVKAVDFASGEPPAKMAASLLDELAAATPTIEVGYIRGTRSVVRAVLRPARLIPAQDIARGLHLVVTGGARGVTAILARELAHRYALKLSILGSTPLDASEKALETQRRLRDLQELGVEAVYHPCDVSDRMALTAALTNARQRFGPIQAVLHGAGIETACRYENKKLRNVQATLGVKAGGMAALVDATRDDPLQWFATMGSVNGRFGGHGQTDYALASDMLSKQVQALSALRPDCAAINFDWPGWGEAGMSVRPESRIALEQAGYTFMPPHEGVAHFIHEIRSGGHEGEVIILDDARIIDQDRIMPGVAEQAAFAAAAASAARMPLIDGVRELATGRLAAEVRFDPVRDAFLADHRFQDLPVLPSVINLEAVAEAASLLGGAPVNYLRDVEIRKMFRFHGAAGRTASLLATQKGNETFVELSAPFHNRQGMLVDPRIIFASGFAGRTDDTPAPSPAPPFPADGWLDFAYLTTEQARQEGYVEHRARFQGLRAFNLQPAEAWGRIVSPDPNALGRTGGSWLVPSVAVDSCLVLCAIHARHYLGLRLLPTGYGYVRLCRLPTQGEKCVAHAQLKEQTNNSAHYDFTLFGEDGAVLLFARGYRSTAIAEKSAP